MRLSPLFLTLLSHYLFLYFSNMSSSFPPSVSCSHYSLFLEHFPLGLQMVGFLSLGFWLKSHLLRESFPCQSVKSTPSISITSPIFILVIALTKASDITYLFVCLSMCTRMQAPWKQKPVCLVHCCIPVSSTVLAHKRPSVIICLIHEYSQIVVVL